MSSSSFRLPSYFTPSSAAAAVPSAPSSVLSSILSNPITKRITDFLSQYIIIPDEEKEEDEKDVTKKNKNNSNNNRSNITTGSRTSTSANPTKTKRKKKGTNVISLGIWSGNLSLQNVTIRTEPMNELFDTYINNTNRNHSTNNQKEAPNTKSTTTAAAAANASSSRKRRNHRQPSSSSSSSSPVLWNMQFVSGTIGSMHIQIPWKQFLLGGSKTTTTTNNSTNNATPPPGSNIHLQNVVLVVTLQPSPPPEMNPNDDDDEAAEGDTTTTNDDHDDWGGINDTTDRERQRRWHRKQKQVLIQDVERWMVQQQQESQPTTGTTNTTTPTIPMSQYIRDKIRQQQESNSYLRPKNRTTTPNNNSTTTTTSTPSSTTTTTAAVATMLQRQEYWLSTYIKNWTKDLLYTLFVNLSVQVDHLKIVVLVPNHGSSMSDTTSFFELGCIVPSIQMNQNNTNSSSSSSNNNNNGGGSKMMTRLSNPIVPTVTMNTTSSGDSSSSDPNNNDDPMDRYIQVKNLCCYIRTVTTTAAISNDNNNDNSLPTTMQWSMIHQTQDIPTKDYIIRPFDIDFHGAVRIPSASNSKITDQQKKPQSSIATTSTIPVVDRKHTRTNTTTTTATSSTTTTTTNDTVTKRKRRGKRDKIDTVPTSNTDNNNNNNNDDDGNDQQQDTFLIHSDSCHSNIKSSSSIGRSRLYAHHRAQTFGASPATVTTTSLKRPSFTSSIQPPYRTTILPNDRLHLRRNSTFGRRSDSNDPPSTTATGDVMTDTLPLAQPVDLGAYYKSTKRFKNLDRSSIGSNNNATTSTAKMTLSNNSSSTELDGILLIGAIHLVCTSTHYKVFNDFIATTIKIRNGRPSISIQTNMRQRLMVENNNSSSISKVSLLDTVSEFQSYNPLVQSWWRYCVGVVVRELRERKRIRVMFQKMFLSFDWSKQSRYRTEYVNAFIKCRLQHPTIPTAMIGADRTISSRLRTVTFTTTCPLEASEERICSIEDVLSVEQILLYRSIARKIYANGFIEMPLSLFAASPNVAIIADHNNSISQTTKAANATTNRTVDQQQSQSHASNLLSMISATCEISRARCYSTIDGPIPEHPPKTHQQQHPSETTIGETSKFGQHSDTSRTSKTNRTVNTSTSNTDRSYNGVAATAMDHIATSATDADTNGFKLIYTFTVHVQKVELLIIEEELLVKGNQSSDQLQRSDGDSSVDDDNTNRSIDISILTDDVRSLQNDEELELRTGGGDGETDAGDPICSSTDYLLFDTPKRVLLQFDLTQLKCSILGDSSSSRYFDFTIGQVKAIGEDDVTLLSVGRENRAPLSEVVLSSSESGFVRPNQRRPSSVVVNDALVLSLVINSNHNFMQCDAPSLQVLFDVATVKKLISFIHKNAVVFPTSLLDRQPQENVRLYVLDQNKIDFPDLNCSVRIQGFDVFLPESRISSINSVDNSMTGTTSQLMFENSTAVLRCKMIEMYSGTAVTELSDLMEDDQNYDLETRAKFESPTTTRQLSMLKLPNLIAGSVPLRSFHLVIAVKGIDIVLSPSTTNLSLFNDPLSFEVLYILNSESLLDLNEAKEEIVAEVSPLHFVISEKIICELLRTDIIDQFQQIPTLKQNVKGDNNRLLPRLEVLSSFLQITCSLSIGPVRVTILPISDHANEWTSESRKLIVDNAMTDFLKVVSTYDVSFPHEAAIDAAMNICIDRLSGIGLPLDEAWEAANLLLLNFLDEVEGQDELESRHAVDIWDYDQTPRNSAIEAAVFMTSARFVEILQNVDDDLYRRDGIYMEFPDGLALNCTYLFYDRYYKVLVPSLVVGSANLHFLRFAPHETASDSSKNATCEDILSEGCAQSVDGIAIQTSTRTGVSLQAFSLDKNYHLGKGGLTLSSIGSDTAEVAYEKRIREQLLDFAVGDLELFFAPLALIGAIDSVKLFLTPLQKKLDQSSRQRVEHIRQTTVVTSDAFCFVKTSTVSILFVSDDLSPFIRFSASDLVASSKSLLTVESKKEQGESTIHFFSPSVQLCNLTREGQLYPEIISSISNSKSHCISLSIEPVTGLHVVANGLRVIVLCQFVNEATQYFTTCQYGVGRLLHHLTNNVNSQTNIDSPMKKTTVTFHDISIIIPRSCHCYDMANVEITEALLTLSMASKSFCMPSVGARVNISEGEKLSDRKENKTPPIFRTSVFIHGFRIFSSLPEKMAAIARLRDSPSFRLAFELNGRAEAGRHVYIPITNSTIAGVDDFTKFQHDEKANRRWRELTISTASVAVVVDNVPQLRVLITDDVENLTTTGIHLDVSLSQFCLLQSIWFSNVQELPQLFPYSAMSLQRGCSPLEVLKSVPDYGSEEFRSFLMDLVTITSEVALVLKYISIRCTFDDDITGSDVITVSNAFIVNFGGAVVHVTTDVFGICRIGVGCTFVSLVEKSNLSRPLLSIGEVRPNAGAWADLVFGLNEANTQPCTLTQAFQLSLFLTPAWTVINLGLNNPEITLSDLAPIFKVFKFVSVYYSDATFGNPSFTVSERILGIKKEVFTKVFGHSRMKSSDRVRSPSLDFRLWAWQPSLLIPFNLSRERGPGLLVEDSGCFSYKYMNIDSLSSQECVARSVAFTVDFFYVIPHDKVRYRNSARKLVESLSFGFRLDTNSTTRHTDFCFRIPFDDNSAYELHASRICLPPAMLQLPTICSPYEDITRSLGRIVCEMTCIVDVLPAVSTALLRLFSTENYTPDLIGISSSENTTSNTTVREEDGVSIGFDATCEKAGETFSMVVSIRDVRIFILDPILGPHLPIAVLSLSSTSLSASQFAQERLDIEVRPTDFPLDDVQVSITSTIWADYFKLGRTRSWEPLLEPYRFTGDFEQSLYRGTGLTYNSDSRLHLNISTALLVVVDEVVDEFNRMVKGFCSSDIQSVKECADLDVGEVYNSKHLKDSFDGNDITHALSSAVHDRDRVAFSLRNMTGQKLRIVRPPIGSMNGTAATTVLYVRHKKATELYFPPSISMVKNLKMTEVEFPGLPNDLRNRLVGIKQHTVDLQVPGFEWLNGVVVDTFGRKFERIFPISEVVKLKSGNDWKVANVLQVLLEVGLRNGGRQISVRSVISVVNKTKHNVGILLHPDPLFKPDESEHSDTENTSIIKANEMTHVDYVVTPGEWFQVPTLIFESSLRLAGTHLGSMWIKPTNNKSEQQESDFSNHVDSKIFFSSISIPFTRLVNESANLFESARFRDVPSDRGKSKLQLCCPVSKHSAQRVPPMCYAIEIDRSPIVRDHASTLQDTGQQHSPVAYTIFIHPPIVITNRLPCMGRFELMHAVNRSVLWSGDLNPGQETSVHSVGLDVPLFLFLNIGFAKTPVGEGALVHHGPDPPPNIRDNLVSLKSIGKAGKAVTKRLGNTLTTIGESADARGLKRIFNAQNRRTQYPNQNGNAMQNEMKVEANADEAKDDLDGKTYMIDNFQYYADDVAQNMTVVDGIGQRLTLSLENIRGGGGQRKVTVFCRFWVLNSTEHCLRYKQENSKLFVSGTVLSPDKDGSLPLNGARAQTQNWKDIDKKPAPAADDVTRRLYAGTPGALATSPGRCEHTAETVAALLDSNLPLDEVAKLAFMFSFLDDHVNIGNHKMCVQLWDGTGSTRYISDWSKGFGVDSVGVAQTISMHCKDGRSIELNVVVTVAPGALANFTSIIRFLPLYAIVNNLPYAVRIWQDSSTFSTVPGGESTSKKSLKWRSNVAQVDSTRINQYELLWGRYAVLDDRKKSPNIGGTAARRSALYIATIYPSEIVPFCLPDSRGERQLRIDPGNPRGLSGSISTSKPGDFTLAFEEEDALKTISHESTRASPHFEVQVPPDGDVSFDDDLGIWFESDYGTNKGLIVKAIRKNSYTFNETEVRVGDELFKLNGIHVANLAFDEAISILKRHLAELSKKRSIGTRQGRNSIVQKSMNYLKDKDQHRLSEGTSMLLTFRTVEERIRQVRMKATMGASRNQSLQSLPTTKESIITRIGDNDEAGTFIHAELKSFPRSHLGLFLVLREENTPPYEIVNHSINCTIYYRQCDCSNLKWQSLKPGKSKRYSWEEPLKPKKLVVRVDTRNLFDFVENRPGNTEVSDHSAPLNTRKSLRSDEDYFPAKSVLIPLDEVGYHEMLTINDTTGRNENLRHSLQFDVEVNRNSRILIVSDLSIDEDQRNLQHMLEELKEKEEIEINRHSEIQELSRCFVDSESDYLDGYKRLVDTINEHAKRDNAVISGLHQIMVEVLEARGLSSDSVSTSCNPYCDIHLKLRQQGNGIFGARDRRTTYYIRKTVSPVWVKQSFIFQVPKEAAAVTRGYKLILRVCNYRALRFHQVMGYARIDLHNVRDQKSLTGWFPLLGRNGRPELNTHGSQFGRGSVKVRVQWIYSISAFAQYSLLLSELRVASLREYYDVIAKQLERLITAEHGKQAELDGIQAVRIEDLLSLPKYKRKENIDNLRRQRVKASMVKRNSVLPPMSLEFIPLNLSVDSQDQLTELPVVFEDLAHESHGFRTSSTANFSRAKVSDLEKQISQKRFNRRKASRRLLDERPNTIDGVIAVSLIRSWSVIAALLNDAELDIQVNCDKIEVFPRLQTSFSQPTSTCDTSESTNAIALKLSAPDAAPMSMQSSIKSYINDWFTSRACFERVACISMMTVLHSGGWLSIRPITALNLPAAYTGMAVKIQYGSETYISDTADVRSLDPTWYKLNRRNSEQNDWEHVSPNDIHIHLAPQLTSGAIRVSIVGEKKNIRPSPKAEVGVVYLSLGATISSCLDCEESHHGLLRWFPLSSPTVPIEGDGGLSNRPPDTEKVNDSDFKEYFAPCIQLALFWSPDNDPSVVDKKNDQTLVSVSLKRQTQSFTDNPKSYRKILPPSVKNYLNADFGWISAALIDSQRSCELLSLNVIEVDLRYWVTSAKTRIGLTVGWLQIDYQDNDEREPIILSPTPTGVLNPVIQMLVVKDNLRSEADTLSFDFIDVSIAELDLTIEERLLEDFMILLSSLHIRRMTKNHANAKEAISEKTIGENLLMFQNEQSYASFASILMSKQNKIEKGDKVYIKELAIGALKVNISYLKGRTREATVDNSIARILRVASDELFHRFFFNGDNSDPFLAWSQTTFEDELRAQNQDTTGPQNLQYFVARLFPNISDAPLRLPGKSVKHQFESATDIVENIFKFYSTESLKQFYKIIGALDIVGNPTMLVTSLVSGIRDFVLTPSTALFNSPTDPSRLGIGVAQGTLSFLSHGASGIFGYASKVAAAAGQAIATISLDAEFRDWHNDKVVVPATNLNRDWKRRGVQNVGYIVLKPIADIVLGVAGGISGVVISPVKGFRQNGSAGFIVGMGAGMIGIYAKPLVGILDAATHFFASIHDIAKSVNVLDRRLQPALKLRLPYAFGLMAVLSPFNRNDACATQIVKKFALKESHHSCESGTQEHIVNVEILPSMGTDVFVIVTIYRVLLARVKKESFGVVTTSLSLEIYFSDDAFYSSKVDDYGHSSVALIISKRDGDKSMRLESKRTGKLFALSPHLAWKTVTSRLGGLTNPEIGTPNPADVAANDFYPFAMPGPDDDGTLIDKFTILADSQYQRELTRLHNAISCILGNFDALVYDKWLSVGRQCSTDGYTSFGMYFFERSDTPEVKAISLHPTLGLTRLPWVGYQTFDKVKSSTTKEQEDLMMKFHDEFSFANELESAYCEGGPKWLVSALASATFEAYSYPPLLPNINVSTSIHKANSRMSHSVPDNNVNCESSLTLYNPRISSKSLNETASMLHPDRIGYDSFFGSPMEDVRSSNVTMSALFNEEKPSDPSVMNSATSSSFRTAMSSLNVDGTLSASSSSIPPGWRNSVWMDAKSEMNELLIDDPSLLISTTQKVDTGEPKSMENGVETNNVAAATTATIERMDRMEQLMEQLLIFSSEQALLRNTPPSSNNDSSYTKNDTQQQRHDQLLLKEMAELRNMIVRLTQQQHPRHPYSNSDPDRNNNRDEEIESLRHELAALRAQLGMLVANSSTTQTQPMTIVNMTERSDGSVHNNDDNILLQRQLPRTEGNNEVVVDDDHLEDGIRTDDHNNTDWSVEQVD